MQLAEEIGWFQWKASGDILKIQKLPALLIHASIPIKNISIHLMTSPFLNVLQTLPTAEDHCWEESRKASQPAVDSKESLSPSAVFEFWVIF